MRLTAACAVGALFLHAGVAATAPPASRARIIKRADGAPASTGILESLAGVTAHEIVTGQHPLSAGATLREFAAVGGGSVPRVFITRDLIDALIASSSPSLAACPQSLGVYAFASAAGYGGDAAPLLRYFPDPLQTADTVLLHTGAEATYTLIDALSLAPLASGVLAHGDAVVVPREAFVKVASASDGLSVAVALKCPHLTDADASGAAAAASALPDLGRLGSSRAFARAASRLASVEGTGSNSSMTLDALSPWHPANGRPHPAAAAGTGKGYGWPIACDPALARLVAAALVAPDVQPAAVASECARSRVAAAASADGAGSGDGEGCPLGLRAAGAAVSDYWRPVDTAVSVSPAAILHAATGPLAAALASWTNITGASVVQAMQCALALTADDDASAAAASGSPLARPHLHTRAAVAFTLASAYLHWAMELGKLASAETWGYTGGFGSIDYTPTSPEAIAATRDPWNGLNAASHYNPAAATTWSLSHRYAGSTVMTPFDPMLPPGAALRNVTCALPVPVPSFFAAIAGELSLCDRSAPVGVQPDHSASSPYLTTGALDATVAESLAWQAASLFELAATTSTAAAAGAAATSIDAALSRRTRALSLLLLAHASDTAILVHEAVEEQENAANGGAPAEEEEEDDNAEAEAGKTTTGTTGNSAPVEMEDAITVGPDGTIIVVKRPKAAAGGAGGTSVGGVTLPPGATKVFGASGGKTPPTPYLRALAYDRALAAVAGAVTAITGGATVDIAVDAWTTARTHPLAGLLGASSAAAAAASSTMAATWGAGGVCRLLSGLLGRGAHHAACRVSAASGAVVCPSHPHNTLPANGNGNGTGYVVTTAPTAAINTAYDADAAAPKRDRCDAEGGLYCDLAELVHLLHACAPYAAGPATLATALLTSPSHYRAAQAEAARVAEAIADVSSDRATALAVMAVAKLPVTSAASDVIAACAAGLGVCDESDFASALGGVTAALLAASSGRPLAADAAGSSSGSSTPLQAAATAAGAPLATAYASASFSAAMAIQPCKDGITLPPPAEVPGRPGPEHPPDVLTPDDICARIDWEAYNATLFTEGEAVASSRDPNHSGDGPGGHLVSPPITIERIHDDPIVLMLHNFLSKAESEHLMMMACGKFKRSTVAGVTGSAYHSARTSATVFLNASTTEIMRRIEERATAVAGYPRSHLEALQVVRYKPGQKYDAHYDWFDPDQTEQLTWGGQRATTLFVYLSESPAWETTGGTEFPMAGIVAKPPQGTAVLFRDTHPNGTVDYRTFHGGLPPSNSTKYGLNVWIRERSRDVDIYAEKASIAAAVAAGAPPPHPWQYAHQFAERKKEEKARAETRKQAEALRAAFQDVDV